MANSNKIEKTEELIAGYQEAKFVVSLVQKQKLTANSLNKPKEKVDISARRFYYLSVIYNTLVSGKLFWKSPLRGLVKNGVLKI